MTDVDLMELRQFVNERLTAMHLRPQMWAWSKEAFALQVTLLAEVMSKDYKSQRLLDKFFPGTNRIPNEAFDDAWAHRIVKIARDELPSA